MYYEAGFFDMHNLLFSILFTAIPLIIVGMILFAVIRGLRTYMANNASPVRQERVTVIGKRMQVWGGSGDSSAKTSYYITFETSAGERVELPVKGPEYGACREGEAGTLTWQGTRFKGFVPQTKAAAPDQQTQEKPSVRPFSVSKANAEHYNWGEDCDGWHLVKGSDLSVIHERMPGKTAEVRHYHERSRQFFFVLSGEAMLEVDGVRLVLRQHEGAEVAPGVPHQMKNERLDDVEFLVISQPTTRGDRIQA